MAEERLVRHLGRPLAAVESSAGLFIKAGFLPLSVIVIVEKHIVQSSKPITVVILIVLSSNRHEGRPHGRRNGCLDGRRDGRRDGRLDGRLDLSLIHI